jgi:hypothetical protein
MPCRQSAPAPIGPLVTVLAVVAASLLAACSAEQPPPAPPTAVITALPTARTAAIGAPAMRSATQPTPTLPPAPATCPVTTPAPTSAIDPPPEDFPALAWHRNAERTLWAGLAPAYRDNQWFAGRSLKVRWWRRGTLSIVGRRLDGPAPPLEVNIDGRDLGTPTPLPSSAPTPPAWAGGGAASGILIPVAGCWEITARTEWDELVIVVYAYPADYLRGWPGNLGRAVMGSDGRSA